MPMTRSTQETEKMAKLLIAVREKNRIAAIKKERDLAEAQETRDDGYAQRGQEVISIPSDSDDESGDFKQRKTVKDDSYMKEASMLSLIHI